MLTPIDIQNHSLKTAVRGYSKKETDDFLEEILKGYEELYKENRELKDKIASLSEGIQYYKQMETTLQKALVLAEKTSTETQEAAKSKADAMTSEAQAKADAILKEAQSEADAMRKEVQAYSDITKAKANRELEDTRNHVRKLVQSYENYRLQFKKLAESQIEMLESEHYSIFAPELAEMLDDAPDADTVMEAERNVPINASSDYYAEDEVAYAATEDADENSEAEEETDPIEETDVTEDVDAVTENDDMESVDEEAGNEETDAETEDVKIADMEITEDTIVPGMEDTTRQSDSMEDSEESKESAWEHTTPKLEDYDEIEVTKTVSPAPQEDSPFTFIDTE